MQNNFYEVDKFKFQDGLRKVGGIFRLKQNERNKAKYIFI